MSTRQQNKNDMGSNPWVTNIEDETLDNDNYRTTLWTGTNLQLTVMSIDVKGDIGLEIHKHTDQFIRIEEGKGLVLMGKTRNDLLFQKKVSNGDAIFVPANTWHNIVNTGSTPLKLYSIYAPPEHPAGTVQKYKPK